MTHKEILTIIDGLSFTETLKIIPFIEWCIFCNLWPLWCLILGVSSVAVIVIHWIYNTIK